MKRDIEENRCKTKNEKDNYFLISSKIVRWKSKKMIHIMLAISYGWSIRKRIRSHPCLWLSALFYGPVRSFLKPIVFISCCFFEMAFSCSRCFLPLLSFDVSRIPSRELRSAWDPAWDPAVSFAPDSHATLKKMTWKKKIPAKSCGRTGPIVRKDG